tara:strand:+ start:178 stop:363 length:186 start_codon:yes stop_codon:yes gene_type:complete
MEFNQNNNDHSKEIMSKNKPIMQDNNIENLNYLYPNGHRITHQMRWYKGCRDKVFKSNIAA